MFFAAPSQLRSSGILGDACITNLDTEALETDDEDIRLTHTLHGFVAENVAVPLSVMIS